MNISTKTINSLISDINNSEILIPSFQRAYVWKIDLIKNLLDSIIKNYPIGSGLLIWKTNENVLGYKEINCDITNINDDKTSYNFIIDGQQRVTTIFKCVNDLIIYDSIIYINYTNSDNINDIYFESFTYTKKIKKTEKLIKLYDVLNNNILESNIFNTLSEKEKYTLQKIKDLFFGYQIPIITVEDQNIERIIEIFERVNTSGKSLTLIDLIIARNIKTFDLENEYRNFLSTIQNDFKDCISYNKCDILRFLVFEKTNKIVEKSILLLDPTLIKNEFKQITRCFNKAIGFFKKIGITNTSILPRNNLIIAIAYFYYLSKNQEPNEHQETLLKKLIFRDSLCSVSGSTNTYLENILKIIKSIYNNNSVLDHYYKVSTKIEIRLLLTKTKFNPRINSISRLYLYLLYNNKPKSLIHNNTILSNNTELNFHHFFPKNYLSKNNVTDKNLIDNISNIIVLSKQENQQITDLSPKEYVSNFQKINNNIIISLNSHFIDLNNDDILNNNFSKFYDNRLNRLTDKVYDLIK